MGSPGRLVTVSPGKTVFLKITLLKKLHPDRRGGTGIPDAESRDEPMTGKRSCNGTGDGGINVSFTGFFIVLEAASFGFFSLQQLRNVPPSQYGI